MALQFEQVKLMQLFVAGRPYAQSRPRFVNGRVISSISPGLKEWRARLRKEVRAASSALEMQHLEGALCVDLVFFIPIKQKSRHGQVCYTKPDKDNLEKPVFDVMEGAKLFKKGDGQIGAGETIKIWCAYGQEGVSVKLSRIRTKKSPQRDAEGVPDAPDWLA